MKLDLSRFHIKTIDNDKKNLSSLEPFFQRSLLMFVIAAFCVTFGVSYTLQTKQAETESRSFLANETLYICSQVRTAANNYIMLQNTTDGMLVDKVQAIAERLKLQPKLLQDMSALKQLAVSENVFGINVTDASGTTIASYPAKYVGTFNYNDHLATQKYMEIIKNPNTIINEQIRPSTTVEEGSVKAIGVARIDQPGIVQVRFSAARYKNLLNKNSLSNLLTNYTIGNDGTASLIDNEGIIVSSSDKQMVGKPFTVLGLTHRDFSSNNGFFDIRYNNKLQLAAYDKHADYNILVTSPYSDIYAKRNILLIWNAFFYFLLFTVVYYILSHLLNKTVIKSIYTINATLNTITNGDLDKRVEVNNFKEFATLSSDINSTVSALKAAIAEAASRIDRELEFAKAIQASALPKALPENAGTSNFKVRASMSTAKEVGGDFYDFFLVGDDLAFVIADVSGKGIPAALFMMTARTEIRNHILSNPTDLAKAITQANDELCANNDAMLFVTAFAGILNHETGEIKYINAGHNKPLFQKDGKFSWLQGRSGPPLASMDGIPYKLLSFKLDPGCLLYTYTDGVTEATNAVKELYGDDRLVAFLNSIKIEDCQAVIDAITNDVDKFCNGSEQADDITMLSVKFTKNLS